MIVSSSSFFLLGTKNKSSWLLNYVLITMTVHTYITDIHPILLLSVVDITVVVLRWLLNEKEN